MSSAAEALLLTPSVPKYARHTIQVNLTHRPKRANIVGNIQLWESGGVFGSSDQIIFLCPATGCKGCFLRDEVMSSEEHGGLLKAKNILRDDSIAPDDVKLAAHDYLSSILTRLCVCRLCGMCARPYELADSYDFSMGVGKIAAVIESFFHLLADSADIYFVHNRDYGGAARVKLAQPHQGGTYKQLKKELATARENTQVRYALANIVKDLSAGATLKGRLEALLRS